MNYDDVAKLYDRTIPPIPIQLINSMQDVFKINHQSKIIDIGCGSGLLTIPLANISAGVQGLDISSEMLGLAHNKDYLQQVKWIHADIESYNLPDKYYDLIIGFESFHQFLTYDLFKKCMKSLVPGGTLAIGWVTYYWETILMDVIKNVFSSYGIGWEDWYYYTCPQLTEYAQKMSATSEAREIVVNAPHQFTVENIVVFLTSIDKIEGLNNERIEFMRQELTRKINTIITPEFVSGNSTYVFKYVTKGDENN